MRVAIGADHAGFKMKNELCRYLRQKSVDVIDVGAHSSEPSDYPDFAAAVGRAIGQGADRGVLICGSGVGASIAANKIPGVRAAVCHQRFLARQGVEDDDMNVLVLGARVIAPEVGKRLVNTFLKARFTQEKRHLRRLKKVAQLESSAGYQ